MRRREDENFYVGMPGDYSVYRGVVIEGWFFKVMLDDRVTWGYRPSKIGALWAAMRIARKVRY